MSDIRQLEQELAYSAARSDIECHCVSEKHSGQHHGRWHDLSTAGNDEEEWVANAVRYLEARNLLKRHPVRNTLVKVLDDSK